MDPVLGPCGGGTPKTVVSARSFPSGCASSVASTEATAMKQDRLPHSKEVPPVKGRERSPTGAASTSIVDPEPKQRGRRWLAWSLFGFGAAWVTVGSVLLLLRVSDGTLTVTTAIQQFALLPPAAAFSIVGLVVALRQPRNACGWLMLVIGTIWSLGVSPPLKPDSLLEWAT